MPDALPDPEILAHDAALVRGDWDAIAEFWRRAETDADLERRLLDWSERVARHHLAPGIAPGDN